VARASARCRARPPPPAPRAAHAAILSPVDIDARIRLALEDRVDIRLAYLFGSCASGTARRGSDVDVAILFDHLPTPASLDRLTEDLGAAAERRVDLVVLNAAPPLLAREVIARGRLIMCRDEDERVRFVTRTTARYQDTAHLRRVQYAYLRERAEAHRAGSR
jgi:predicted nucleotidyltransferase